MAENGTIADIAAVTRPNYGADAFGFGGGGGIWLFAILALMFCGGGFGGWNNAGAGYANGFANAIGYENLATSNEVQRGFDNQNTMANQREILSAVNAGVSNLAQVTADKYNEITRDLGNLGMLQQQTMATLGNCCAETKLMIQGTAAQNRYDSAMNTAAINATTTEQTQKILDVLTSNKIEALQGKINQLELQAATSNVLRYPNSWTYNAGMSPFCGCNCNGYA